MAVSRLFWFPVYPREAATGLMVCCPGFRDRASASSPSLAASDEHDRQMRQHDGQRSTTGLISRAGEAVLNFCAQEQTGNCHIYNTVIEDPYCLTR